MVMSLIPFTEYNFSVSAFTTVGEGPATLMTQKTPEQGKTRPKNHNSAWNKASRVKDIVKDLAVTPCIYPVVMFESLSIKIET